MGNQNDLFLILLLLCLVGNNNVDQNGDFPIGINKANDILIIFMILGLFNQSDCYCERVRDRERDIDF